MKLSNFVLSIFVALCAGWFSTAEAANLYTSPLAGTHGDVVNCMITNPTDEPVDVTVTLYEQTAGSVFSEIITVPARGILGAGTEPQVYSEYYCQFSVSKKTKIRAMMWLIGLSGEIIATAEAR